MDLEGVASISKSAFAYPYCATLLYCFLPIFTTGAGF